MLKYLLYWFPMVIIAVFNGAARDMWYKKYTGELAAHQISTISLIILLGFYIRLIINKLPPESGRQAILIGVLWMTLTLVFEFGFGLLRGNSWTSLLSDYNFLNGRIWILIPIWIKIAPYLFYRMAMSR